MHRRPTLAKRRVNNADLRAPHGGRSRASCARRHLREEGTRSPSGRASILKNGLALHEAPFLEAPSLKESC
jgi:hypothetical protein